MGAKLFAKEFNDNVKREKPIQTPNPFDIEAEEAGAISGEGEVIIDGEGNAALGNITVCAQSDAVNEKSLTRALQNEWQNGQANQDDGINQETVSDTAKDEPLTGNKDGKAKDGKDDESEPLTGNETGKADDGEDDESAAFKPSQKNKAAEFFAPKPEPLNKRLILAIILGLFIALTVTSVLIVPAVKRAAKKKKAEDVKPKTNYVVPQNYEALAPQKTAPVSEPQPDAHNEGYSQIYFEEGDEIPEPIIDGKYRYIETENPQTPQTTASHGGGSSSRPDTRNDGLQSKRITGIKGLTAARTQQATPAQTAGAVFDALNPYAQFSMPTKDAYTQQLLSQYGAAATNPYAQQNDQSGKNGFYENGRGEGGGTAWLPQNALWQGSIFEAALTSAISTDLPGDCTAVVTKNVYSSLDGRFMLIPQGSILFGSYNSSISYAQSRVQVGWYALIRPDGLQITLGNMAAADAQGKAGLKGIINDHPFQYLKALGLITAMNVAVGEFRGTAQQSANPYIQQLMADSVNITTRFGEKLIDRALDVQPTITVKAGTKINVVTNMNLFIPPLEPYQVFEPYKR